jgi:acyl dehydratase
MTRKLYFEDLFVGQRFVSAPYELSAEEIIRFARENDPQFFHVDEEAAKSSLFDGLVASGWQTAALCLRLLLASAEAPFAGGVVGADVHVSWRLPVRPGDRLRLEAEVTGMKPSRSQPDRGFVTMRLLTFNQDEAQVQTIEATMLVFRDPERRRAPD